MSIFIDIFYFLDLSFFNLSMIIKIYLVFYTMISNSKIHSDHSQRLVKAFAYTMR